MSFAYFSNQPTTSQQFFFQDGAATKRSRVRTQSATHQMGTCNVDVDTSQTSNVFRPREAHDSQRSVQDAENGDLNRSSIFGSFHDVVLSSQRRHNDVINIQPNDKQIGKLIGMVFDV